jgi:hypothetical protein
MIHSGTAIKPPFSGDGSWGGLWGAIDSEFHIVKAGKVEFNDANTFTALEIDFKWDKLILKVGIDIPAIKIGKFCLVPVPDILESYFGDDCLVEFPGGELFKAVPDLYIKLNLNDIFQFIITEISIISKVKIEHTSKPPDPDYWGIYLDPVAVDAIQLTSRTRWANQTWSWRRLLGQRFNISTRSCRARS